MAMYGQEGGSVLSTRAEPVAQDQTEVEYRLTDWGQQLCPALDALLKWAECRDDYVTASRRTTPQ